MQHLKVCDYPYRVDCGGLPPNPNPIQPDESAESATEIEQPTGVTPEYPTAAPEQPSYPAPEQPSYPAPEQPSYPAPEQPASEQPAYPAEGTPVTETTVVAELPPSYFNKYNFYHTQYYPNLKRVPAQPQRYVAQPQRYVAQPQRYVAQPQRYVAQPAQPPKQQRGKYDSYYLGIRAAMVLNFTFGISDY